MLKSGVPSTVHSWVAVKELKFSYHILDIIDNGVASFSNGIYVPEQQPRFTSRSAAFNLPLIIKLDQIGQLGIGQDVISIAVHVNKDSSPWSRVHELVEHNCAWGLALEWALLNAGDSVICNEHC